MDTTTAPAPTTTFDFEAELETVNFRELTLTDRCDRDFAEAAVAQVLLPTSDEPLLLCGHHFMEYYDRLHVYPHDVPEDFAKPMTWARAEELGHVSRAQGDDHA